MVSDPEKPQEGRTRPFPGLPLISLTSAQAKEHRSLDLYQNHNIWYSGFNLHIKVIENEMINNS